ncbi:methylated-DNA--[protein]-cysteine S-methyltransferase [Porticoccus litoralis]|uniref:methylated-DNA--[protein]-cysteine S-methyltransferase n=1 Tax=Porticoccus litoralis TaxID=434086 RepID=UPI0034E28666
MDLYWGSVVTPMGGALLVGSRQGIQRLWFEDTAQGVTLAGCQRADGRAQAVFASLMSEPATTVEQFDVQGTAFQRQVWQALLEIPLGMTTTYQVIADAIDRPKAVRAVANAIGANPIAYFIPCHRVVRSDGGLGGYRWGVERKRAILDWERDRVSRAA